MIVGKNLVFTVLLRGRMLLILACFLITFVLGCSSLGVTPDRPAVISLDLVSAQGLRDLAWLNFQQADKEQFLRVTFSTNADLRSFVARSSSTLWARVYTCHMGHPDFTNELGDVKFVYDERGTVYPANESDVSSAIKGKYVYHTYFRKPSDLSDDVCVVLNGGQMLGGSFESDPMDIPKAMIDAAVLEYSRK